MSLTSIINSASSALTKTQYGISVSNTNIANASDTNYARQSFTGAANTSATALNSGEVTRAGDAYLARTVRSSASTAAAADTRDTYLQAYDAALGSLSNGDDLSTLLGAMATALSALAASLTSVSAETTATTATDAIAQKLRDLSNVVQDLRTQASTDLESATADANTQLNAVATLNDQILTAKAAGSDTASLEDARDAALQALSELIGVTTFTQSDGRTVVYSQGGQLLVGQSAAQFSYDAGGTVAADLAYPGGAPALLLNGVDITTSSIGGSMGALIELRDTTLPAEQDKLDQIAAGLARAINAVANSGTSLPAPSSISSSRTVASTDAFDGAGSVRIAIVDNDGVVVSSTELDLSSFATLTDLTDALNAIGGVSATIQSGKLTITATDTANGVAIGALDSSLGANGDSFSSYFGFNDVFTGSSASSIALTKRLSDDPALWPASQLSSAASLNAGDIGLTSGDGSQASTMAQALDVTMVFSAKGAAGQQTSNLQSLTTSFVAKAAALISNASDNADQTASVRNYAQTRLSSLTGVNLDEETAFLTQLQTQYQANAQLITMARELFNTLLTMVS